jgi:HK97 family phage portal protein
MSIFTRRKDAELAAKDASFEAWLAQRGTQFLPTTTTWPPASMSAELASSLPIIGESYSAIYRSQPSVYTVVEFLAWQLSQIGIKVYERVSDTDRRQLSDSPIAQLLREPAPGLTYTRFMHRTVADLCIFGNCYWLKLQRGDSRMVVPLPAPSVTPRGGTLLQADVYQVGIGSGQQAFNGEDVIHFRRYSPDDARIGVSPLEPLRRIIAEEASSSRAREVFWRKNANMGGLLIRSADNPLSAEARDRLREDWRRYSRGGDREGDTALLEDGIDFKPISFSPKEAEFIEGRKLTLETVARAFNIPLSVLGLTQTATYASQKEFHKALYQDTLGPWATMIEDEIQHGLVPWFTNDPDVYVEFNLEEKLRGSFEEKASQLLDAGGGPYMTRNEVRALLNLPRMDDEQADELVITNNMQGTEAEPPSAPVVQMIAPVAEETTP